MSEPMPKQQKQWGVIMVAAAHLRASLQRRAYGDADVYQRLRRIDRLMKRFENGDRSNRLYELIEWTTGA